MKRVLILILIASMALLVSCSKESSTEELDFSESSTVEISDVESSEVESSDVESSDVESSVVESSAETIGAEAKSTLDLSEFKQRDMNTEYDDYLNVAIPLGLLAEHWSSPEELNAENILASIGYFNQVTSETPDLYYIEETELEDYVLSKVDISADKLRNTKYYSDGKYHFEVKRDVGGVVPIEMPDYYQIEDDTYLVITSLITNEKSIVKIDSDGKFVSYMLKEK